jgi:hypothetical protein
MNTYLVLIFLKYLHAKFFLNFRIGDIKYNKEALEKYSDLWEFWIRFPNESTSPKSPTSEKLCFSYAH